MAQVKFYSVSAATEKTNPAGVYFVDGGELYKGTQRFGLGRVTVDADFVPSTSFKDGQARGDIVVTGTGAGWVFNGTSWISIGGDIGTITSAWQSDIKTWTGSLASGDSASYIAYIDKNGDGKLTAHAVAFPTLATGDADGQIKLGTTNATVSGWSAVKSDIANLKAVVSYSGSGDSVVTATTGIFTNLTVTDTATFSATVVSAGSLTVGGVSVNNVAAASATGNNNGVAVTVSTLGGGVNAVGVAVTGNLATFAGKSVVETVGADGTASNNNIATEKAVRDAIKSLDNAMHLLTANATITLKADGSLDSVTLPGDVTAVVGGVAIDANKGLEAVCTSTTGPTWELIGDQNTYVTKTTYAADMALKASVGTDTTAVTHGVSAAITLKSNAAPDIGITVDAVTASAGIATNTDKLVTAGAVADYVAAHPTAFGTAADKNVATAFASTGSDLPTESQVATYVGTEISSAISALDANVSSSNQTGLTVSVTQADGVVTAVQAELAWLDANGDPITAA